VYSNAKPVIQYRVSDDSIVKEYASLTDASSEGNYSYGHIRKSCMNLAKRINPDYYWRFKDEARATSSEVHANSLRVHQYTIAGQYIKPYHSSESAARETGGSSEAIRFCCAGKGYSSGGYVWKYTSDEPPEENIVVSDRANTKPKAVEYLDLSGTVVTTFRSIHQATQVLKMGKASIVKYCDHPSLTYKDHSFRWG
jgi:hypothetical protein